MDSSVLQFKKTAPEYSHNGICEGLAIRNLFPVWVSWKALDRCLVLGPNLSLDH
jgi:hypothetical protein